jgi:hypothetical protein
MIKRFADSKNGLVFSLLPFDSNSEFANLKNDFFYNPKILSDVENKKVNQDLHAFYQKKTGDLEKHRILKSYKLVEEKSGAILALISLSNDAIRMTKQLSKKFKEDHDLTSLFDDIKVLPAIKIESLIINSNVRGSKHGYSFGKLLLDMIESYFLNDNIAGCVAITLESYKERVNFYQKSNYEKINVRSQGNTISMYKLLV